MRLIAFHSLTPAVPNVSGTESRLFHRTVVTSNLDPQIRKADHGQGGSGMRKNRETGPNFFVVTILTSNFLGLKILQGLFAELAPGKAFKGDGGRGYTRNSRTFPEMS